MKRVTIKNLKGSCSNCIYREEGIVYTSFPPVLYCEKHDKYCKPENTCKDYIRNAVEYGSNRNL